MSWKNNSLKKLKLSNEHPLKRFSNSASEFDPTVICFTFMEKYLHLVAKKFFLGKFFIFIKYYCGRMSHSYIKKIVIKLISAVFSFQRSYLLK